MYVMEIQEVTYAPRTVVNPRRIRFERPHSVSKCPPGEDEAKPQWQVDAIGEYEESLQPLEARLRGEMAYRILELTGHELATGDIYVDARSQTAVATVDCMLFKLLKGNLLVFRACVQCNCGQYASPPVSNRAEL